LKGLLLRIPNFRENGRGGAVKSGGETTGKKKILEIVRSMVRNNHPVSADRGFLVVKHAREGWFACWLEEGATEDPLEALRGYIFRIVWKMEKDPFLEPDRFGRGSVLSGSTEDGIREDGAEGLGAVASCNEAAEEDMDRVLLVGVGCGQTINSFDHADDQAAKYSRRVGRVGREIKV
jgi:hypothetical protein